MFFFDVGAQFGHFSAIGADSVGVKGSVHMFEPAHPCFSVLDDFINKNKSFNLVLNKIGVSDENGSFELTISAPPYLSSHSFVPFFLEKKGLREYKRATCPVIRLDDYINNTNIIPTFIKIDVEGYEFKVLKGLENFFKTRLERPTIICELSPSAYQTMNHTTLELFDYMKRFGYQIFYGWNSDKKISTPLDLRGHNVIFKMSS